MNIEGSNIIQSHLATPCTRARATYMHYTTDFVYIAIVVNLFCGMYTYHSIIAVENGYYGEWLPY